MTGLTGQRVMSDDPTSPIQQFDGPPVDPRFRRRWAEARRAEGRRRLKVLLARPVGGAVVGAGVSVCFTLRCSACAT